MMNNIDSSTTPDGPRLNHLRLALYKMLQTTIKNCSGVEKIEQCFPFGLNHQQTSQVDKALWQELENLSNAIKTPVEGLMQEKDLPAKLNEIDKFLRINGNNHVSFEKLSSPEEQTSAACSDLKKETASRLLQQVETLEWQLTQRRGELDARRDQLLRRCEHLQDSQRLLDVAFMGVSTGTSGELETLVDRMIHQTVPIVATNENVHGGGLVGSDTVTIARE